MLVVCLSTGLLLWAMTAKKCRTSAKKIPSKKGSKIVQSLGIHVEVQKKKNMRIKNPRINGISALHQQPRHPSSRRPFRNAPLA